MVDASNDTGTPAVRRAQWVCVTGLLIQLTLFGVVLGVGLWGDYSSDAVVAAAFHLLGGVPIWLILLVVFTLRRRSKVEDLETEQLRRSQEAGLAANIFDVGDESMLLQRRRLNWTFKFLLPVFTVLIAVYHLLIGGGFLFVSWQSGQTSVLTGEWSRTSEPFALMLFAGGAAVFCFAYARYVIGMSRQEPWHLLRSGGSYLLGNALSASVVLVSMALAQIDATKVWAEPVATYVIRIVVLLFGVEVLVNFILDFYRPRRPGEEPRPAFDSRLLALFSEPGGVIRSIAQTINYQFGFEVSGTWFYKLLQRSVFPLVMMTILALILLSSVVVVDVDEQAYIEHFGDLAQKRSEVLGPGFHLKWPWPIDRVARERVDMIRTLTVGGDHEAMYDELYEGEEHDPTGPLLWGDKHDSNPEMLMIVASPPGSELTADSTPVSLLMVSMQIDYRIKDLYAYRYHCHDPEKVMETIAYQELSNYTAGVSSMELMGHGRSDFGRHMRERLQRRCDQEVDLGIEITFVCLQEAHPPAESNVAATFQGVVTAEIRKEASIVKAKGRADRILTLTAGSVERAKELDAAVKEYDILSAEAGGAETPEVLGSAGRINELLFGDKAKGIAPASGKVAAEIAGARASRSVAISRAQSKVRSFRNDLVAYESAPALYKMRRYLQLLREKLPRLRKFVFTSDLAPGDLIIEYETRKRTTLDLETAETP